jgi:hypothetical protein
MVCRQIRFTASDDVVRGPTIAVPVTRRLRRGRRQGVFSSAVTGSATRLTENQRQGQGQRQGQVQRPRQRQGQVQRQRSARGPTRERLPATAIGLGVGHGHGRDRDGVPRRGAGYPPAAQRAQLSLCFFETPACRRVRLRLRSGSPPCGGLLGSSGSDGFGHRRASRRPSCRLWRISPERHTRGCPPRECARACSKRRRHILKDCTPAGTRVPVFSGARDSRAPGRTRGSAPVTRCVRDPRRGASHFAGRVSVAGLSILFQR